MNRIIITLLTLTLFFLTGCSPIKSVIKNQYQLNTYSKKQLSHTASRTSILVTAPEAVSLYRTDQMFYIKKPYEIGAFAHNAWIDPPADMLFPLIVQSLEQSGYFYAVASSTSSEQTNYRLDTQLLKLQQNFLKKPSTLDFAVKIVLTDNHENRVIASRVINQQIPCSSETPYGGVIAANRATMIFTTQLTDFVVKHIGMEQNKH